MLHDLTLLVTPTMTTDAQTHLDKALFGHLGTHFDVMDKPFPLDYLRRDAMVFDVSAVPADRDIGIGDIELEQVGPGMFVAFYSGFMDREPYGTKAYFKEHPQLAGTLIDALLDRKVSIIGIDFAGVRRGAEHTPMDQRCADRGTFVVENLTGLSALLGDRPSAAFVAHTYPMHFAGMTGLPCRVVAETE